MIREGYNRLVVNSKGDRTKWPVVLDLINAILPNDKQKFQHKWSIIAPFYICFCWLMMMIINYFAGACGFVIKYWTVLIDTYGGAKEDRELEKERDMEFNQ